MLSDGLFFNGIQKSVDLFSNFSDNPVYYYNFAHRPGFSFTKFFGVRNDSLKGNRPKLNT